MRRAIGLVLGAALIVLLVHALPQDVFAVTASVLYVVAALILLLVAAALFVAPARRAISAVFALGVRVPEGALFGMVPDAQLRRVLSPLIVAGVCAAVAALGTLLR